MMATSTEMSFTINYKSQHMPLLNSTIESDTDQFQKEVSMLLTYKIAMIMDRYWFPVLVPCGLVGNTLSLLVMLKRANRRMSTCIYMLAIRWVCVFFVSYVHIQCSPKVS